MGEDTGSDTGYDASDGEWLSYAELATRRGIDRQSAFKLAARHRWQRQKGNTGHVRVFVPSAFAEPEDKSSDGGYDLSHHLVVFETALITISEAHHGEVRALEGQIVELREAHAVEVAALQAERDQARAAVQAAVEATRAHVDELQVDLIEARERVKQAERAMEEVRAGEAARKARGLVARLRSALRGE